MHYHHDVSIKAADDGTFVVSCEDRSEDKSSKGETMMPDKKLYTAKNMKEVMTILNDYFSESEASGKDKAFKKGMKMAEMGGE